MCGLVGYISKNTPEHRDALTRLLIESAYRGLHSFGMVWQHEGKLSLCHASNPDPNLISGMVQGTFRDLPTICMMGHLRYCTSDPGWPLPIICDDVAIVLNGVISQETPSRWPNPSGEPWQTGNDAEIALRYVFYGIPGQHGGSFAIGTMDAEGEQVWVRNGHRPLWFRHTPEVTYHCSTRDIAIRAFPHDGHNVQLIPCYGQDDLQIPTPPVPPCAL